MIIHIGKSIKSILCSILCFITETSSSVEQHLRVTSNAVKAEVAQEQPGTSLSCRRGCQSLISPWDILELVNNFFSLCLTLPDTESLEKDAKFQLCAATGEIEERIQ